MPYTKTTWVNGSAPYINETNLNKIELGIETATSIAEAASTFDGAYASLTGAPTNVSSFTNDSGYLTAYTETDPVVGAINGIVKSNGLGTISAATAGVDYLVTETSHADVLVDGDFATAGFMVTNGAGVYSVDANTYLTSYTETDPVVGAINGLVKANGAGVISAAVAGAGNDYIAVETDPVVGAINGIVKADGIGGISAAVAGTDYSTFDGAYGSLTGAPTIPSTFEELTGSIVTFTPLTAEPGVPANGMLVVADGVTWDPATKAGAVSYPVYYDGVAWNALY